MVFCMQCIDFGSHFAVYIGQSLYMTREYKCQTLHAKTNFLIHLHMLHGYTVVLQASLRDYIGTLYDGSIFPRVPAIIFGETMHQMLSGRRAFGTNGVRYICNRPF
jgi:hypothetical protein